MAHTSVELRRTSPSTPRARARRRRSQEAPARNLRLHRWRDAAEAVDLARVMCAGALLVKLNADEARFRTGAGDALLGVVLAALVRSGYATAAVAEALPRAVAVAARTTEAFGAVGSPSMQLASGLTESG